MAKNDATFASAEISRPDRLPDNKLRMQVAGLMAGGAKLLEENRQLEREVEQLRAELLAPSTAEHLATPAEALIAAIRAELCRAKAKFPEPTATMTALMEEVGELAKAMLEESSDRVVAEAVQVAVMAIRVAIEGDASLDPIRTHHGVGQHGRRRSLSQVA